MTQKYLDDVLVKCSFNFIIRGELGCQNSDSAVEVLNTYKTTL